MHALLSAPLLAMTGGASAPTGSSSVALQLAPVDYLILVTYFIFVIAIGWVIRRSTEAFG